MIKGVMSETSLIVSHFPGVRLNEPLADKTTFGVGGRAAGYLLVQTPEVLIAAVTEARLQRIPFWLIAGGSNILFCDDFYPGLVIQYKGAGAPVIEGQEITVEAGLALSQLIHTATAHGLAGLETLSGIPGTVGGAVVGNAGAYGQGIADTLTGVQIFDGKKLFWLTKADCHFAYRESIFKKKPWLVLRARFQLKTGDPESLAQKAQEIISIRERKYTPGLRCPGSFFKNVLVAKVSNKTLQLIDQTKIIDGKIPAGYLLQAAGACGAAEGGARVADFHGNLIINEGEASYHDVMLLVSTLKELVRRKFGIKLEEEVRYMI